MKRTDLMNHLFLPQNYHLKNQAEKIVFKSLYLKVDVANAKYFEHE